MYELVQAKGDSYYIQSPAKIGVFRLNETAVCLIDSGNDKDAGRKGITGPWPQSTIPIPTPIISEGINTCKARAAAGYLRLGLNVDLPIIRCLSPPFYMAGFLLRI